MRHTLLCIVAALVTLGCARQEAPRVTEGPTAYYGQRASLFEMLPVDSTKIVFLGNSLTNGCEWHELAGMESVVNRGINGDDIEGIENRLTAITSGHPKKIFLMAGVNDVSHNLDADSIAGATVRLVDRIKEESPETRIYVESLLPINNSFGRYSRLADKEQTIRDINKIVAGEMASRGVTWIDLYPKFCDADSNLRAELTNDGLHLLGPGYMIWYEEILPYVQE